MKYLLTIILMLVCPAVLFAALPETPVAKADKKTIRLQAGTNQGLKAGMRLDVFRQEERIIHPITGEELGSPKVKIAEVQITKVYRTTAIGKITMSYAPIAAGDLVREAGSIPMQPAEMPVSGASAEKKAMPIPSDDAREMAERLTREIADLQSNISSLSRTLGRIAKIESSIAKMRGDIGAMESNISSLKQEVESLKVKSSTPEVVSINRDNLAEFKVKYANLNVAVRSGPEPLLIPVEAFAQIILPYVKGEQQAVVDSLVRAKVEEMKAGGGRTAEVKEVKHVEGGTPHPAPRPEEDPMAELQKLLDEGKSKPTWKVYLENYWPFGAGVGVFLGIVIVVIKLVRRKKTPSDDEEGILAIDEEMLAEGPIPEAEEEEQK